jgi:hypothetical protein
MLDNPPGHGNSTPPIDEGQTDQDIAIFQIAGIYGQIQDPFWRPYLHGCPQ